MTYFKKIFAYAGPYKIFIGLNVFFNIFYALFSAFSFIAMVPMLNVLFGETPKVDSLPTYTGLSDLKNYVTNRMNYEISQTVNDDPLFALMLTIGLILVLFLLKNTFNYFALFFITFLRNGILKDLRNDLFQKIIDLPISFFSEKKKGDTIARMTADVLEIQHSFLSILEVFIREPLTIVFTLILMFNIDVNLSLFVLLFIPISGLIISSIGKALKRKSDRVQKEQGDFLSIIEETLGGLTIVKAFFAEKQFYQKFAASTNRFYHYNNTLINRQNLASPMSEFLGIGVIGGLLWFGGKMVLVDQTLSGTLFLSFMLLAYNILTPAKAISKASYTIRKGDAAAERVLELLETENSIKESSNPQQLDEISTGVQFNKVDFSYGTDRLLENFNLELKKGQTVALVGESGSGKTTLAKLLNRFYDVSGGEISIDGINIKDIAKENLRQHIGVVTQEAILFNDTVANNLCLGKHSATLEEMVNAAKIANAHDFIMELPHGYQTNIGDGGGKLSGGQKQRLSIARAILKNPTILVLDEATSALDSASENLVQEALEKLMQDRTSLVIAHRLSTIQKADTIVVLDKGKIVEQGSHKELMQANGAYATLVKLQRL
ncbi:MAG: ABC transporter ATP-binding protein/permease [Flavobacteriaceae bacterium]|nr:ABC transporter ATP-binding protein/permease [Flavobacteriaceae bacterium]